MSEEAMLVDEASAGSMPAFEQLVLLYGKRIYNYCYRMTENKEDAEDTAQEVFIKAYRSLNGFKRNSSFSTWLFSIAYNACIDILRKKKLVIVPIAGHDEDSKNQIAELASNEPSVEEEVLMNERKNAVHKAIAKLKPEYRTVILLREIDGLSYDEIASVLNIPLGTVKSYISRARDELRTSLINEIGKDGK